MRCSFAVQFFMKKIPGLPQLAFLGVLATAILLTGRSDRKATPQPTTAPATASTNAGDKTRYSTSAEIAAMVPRTAMFVKRLSEFSGSFTTADGRGFVLGDPVGEQWVWHFLAALKEGQTYKFPDAFLNYQNAPNYGTAKAIAEMAPRTGTLATRSPCSSYFNTTDGKGFSIGDPGSGAQVSQFLWTLKQGETCKFPDAFLDYQAAPKYVTVKEIIVMAPRTATLVASRRDSYFKTADGKGFFIGGRGSGAEVDSFLRTLEEGKAYEFPDAFLKY